jgi:hypothetical protein
MQKPTLPKGWNQVSLEQFIELRKLKGEDGAFNHKIDIMCILTDTYADDWDDVEILELNEWLKDLKWLYTEPSKRASQTIARTKIDASMEEMYLKPMNELTLGEFIDLEYYFTNDYIDNLPKICAILYQVPSTFIDDQPIFKGVNIAKASQLAHRFLDQPITSVYGVLTDYIKFRDQFINKHHNLMNEDMDDDLEDIDDPEERKEAEKKKSSNKWGWEQMIWSMCNGDITKYDDVINMKLVLIFNFLAMRKELDI